MNAQFQGDACDCDRGTILSRRDALARLVALAVGASLAGSKSLAQEPRRRMRFDLHHHFVPPWWKGRVGPVPALQGYSPTRALEAMDRADVQTAFLSLPARLGDDPVVIREESIRVARETNEYGASLVSGHRDRFGLFAYLPLPDIDASLLEIEYAFDTLRANGVGLLTSYGNHWLGDSAFQPVFDELNRRRAVVYTHPTDGPCCHSLLPNTIPQTVEWNTRSEERRVGKECRL